jgi:hypothetical protein
LCDDGDCGPGYDLWHVLFECSATSEHPEIVAVFRSCVDFVPQLAVCDSIQNAVQLNGASMSNTEHAGVSQKDIVNAVARVRETAPAWQGTTGIVSHWHWQPQAEARARAGASASVPLAVARAG